MKRGSIIIVIVLLCAAIAWAQGSAILPYITTYIRTLLDDADAVTARTTLEAAGWSTTEVHTPTDAGETGDFYADPSWLYVCIAANTWRRVAISTWTSYFILLESDDYLLLETDDRTLLESSTP